MTTTKLLTLTSTVLLSTALSAQIPGYLMTYSQPETTLSGTGGTVLATLRPNEICHYDLASTPCATASAEKWLPHTAANVMAGDADANGDYDDASIFGRIDALLTSQSSPTAIGGDNQRNTFWSPSIAMGNAISANPFRPGDVARIVRGAIGEGQVEYFMRQEQFVQALGMPVGSSLDIDAIAFSPNYGVFFSLDSDTPAITDCGPMLVRDGDIICIPPYGLTYTADMRIASVVPSVAVVVHNEIQMNLFTNNANVTNRFGSCVSLITDVESLEIDFSGPTTTVSSCAGIALPVPTLIYSVDTGTGGSLLTTQFGGQIYSTPCGPAGTSCGFGPTFGNQVGIQPTSATVGAASHVNALSIARACRTVLEPQQHTVNVFPLGAPAGFMQIDYASQFGFNLSLIEIVPPVIPWSVNAFPWSQQCFPDLYAPSISVWAWPLGGPAGSFGMPAIPPLWMGKVLFQNVSFGSTLELSTPCVVDVN